MPRRKNDERIDPAVFAANIAGNAPRDHAVLIKLTADEHLLFSTVVASRGTKMAHVARALIIGYTLHHQKGTQALLAPERPALPPDEITAMAEALAAREKIVPRPAPSAAVQSSQRPPAQPVVFPGARVNPTPLDPPWAAPAPTLAPPWAAQPAPVAPVAPPWAPPAAVASPEQPEDMEAFIARTRAATPRIPAGADPGFTATPMPFDPDDL